MPTPSPSHPDAPQPAPFFSWQTLFTVLKSLGSVLHLVLRLWLIMQPAGTPPHQKTATSA